MEERKNEPRECVLFYCDKKRRQLCCRDCTEKRCRNKCLNSPDKCGLYGEKEEDEK